MKPLSYEDASCIALAVEYRKMPPDAAAQLLKSMKDPQAKLLFQALLKDESEWDEFSADVVQAAKEYIHFAQKHRQMAEELCQRPCGYCGRSGPRR